VVAGAGSTEGHGGGQEYGVAPLPGWAQGGGQAATAESVAALPAGVVGGARLAQGGGQAITAELVTAPPPAGGVGWAGLAQGGGHGAGLPSAVAYIGHGRGHAGAVWPADAAVAAHGGGQAVAPFAPLPV